MKRHHCAVLGCGKAFSRPSHLQRHALNHSTSQWVCERCYAGFKRLDLLERHKSRHVLRDESAGGVGLGVLETKRKRIRQLPAAVAGKISDYPSEETSDSHQLATPVPRDQKHLYFPAVPSVPSRQGPTRGASSHDAETTASADIQSGSASSSSEQPNPQWQPLHHLNPSVSNAEYGNQQLQDPVSVTSPIINNHMYQSPGTYEIGNMMYHDMTFDQFHFSVMGFMPQLADFRMESHPQIGSAVGDTDAAETQGFVHVELPTSDASHSKKHQDPQYPAEPMDVSGYQSIHHNDMVYGESTYNAAEVLIASSRAQPETQAVAIQLSENSAIEVEGQAESCITEDPPSSTNSNSDETSHLIITTEKREELIDLLDEIRPVRPDGGLIDGDSPEISLENMQTYLDLFLEYFNTSYPLLHVPTLDINTTGPVPLLSGIILGATYKDKDAHQLSVCLYDAIIPFIFSGLLSSPVPDLSILQAFLVLECYGVYRAGPYQRENAILIHGLLLNAIRRISRYHVRAKITLPDRLTHRERDWREFAYAEQYKRLILLFFIWDTQNASCYSFMPNLSIQSLSISLPCSKKLWEATDATEWKELLTEHDNNFTLLDAVQTFVDTERPILSKPFDALGLSLALHGLVSMCNDMLHFDSRSIFLGEHIDQDDVNWSPWRLKMAHSLSSWKAMYDAYAMKTIWSLKIEPLHCEFQRDSTAIFALYHMAHIVINCEIRHLQTAAGAKAIFGHLVQPSDYEESCRWVRNWVTNSPGSARRAAWHAACMFREGMLHLLQWDVHGVFHYPWCLYIGTLTIWAFHHFGAQVETAPQPSCDHSGPEGEKDLAEHSRDTMNYLVAVMASVTPLHMDGVMGKYCTHGLTTEMAKYLRGVRWTAAYEAMKVLEGLSKMRED